MRRPHVFETSMPGFADDSEWSNSNSGSGGQGSSVNCAPEVSRSAQPRRSPPTANAGGGRPDTSDCTPRCRTATSTGSEYQGLPAKPQPTEPPDTDPYVRWCGRGLTEGPQPSVSPYPDPDHGLEHEVHADLDVLHARVARDAGHDLADVREVVDGFGSSRSEQDERDDGGGKAR